MSAARRGNSEIVMDLIDAGADLDISDDYNNSYGGTALIQAVNYGAGYPECTRRGRTMKECCRSTGDGGSLCKSCVSAAATCPHVCQFAKGDGPGEEQETRYFDTVQVQDEFD